MTRCFSKKEAISRYFRVRKPQIPATSIEFRLVRQEIKWFINNRNLDVIMRYLTSDCKIREEIGTTAPSGSVLATQCQSVDVSDPFTVHQAKQDTEFTLPIPASVTSDAEIGAQDRAISDIDELSPSAVHHIVSTTPSRIGGIVACIDPSIISHADFDIAEPTPRFFATMDSVDDFLPETNDGEVEALCALFGSLGFNGNINIGEWSASPSFDDLCDTFQSLEISPSASDVSLRTFSRHVQLASTPTPADRITGHGAYRSYTEDSFAQEFEIDCQQYDRFEDSPQCALPISDSIPNIVTMESASSFTSVSDYGYDGDSESSHDESCIIDTSTSSFSVIARDGDDDFDDFDGPDMDFEELGPSPSFGLPSPIQAPRLQQCIDPMFLSLLSRRVTDLVIVQDGAFGGPAQAAQSSSHALPVPLASCVGLRTLTHFSESGASIWSPFAPSYASPLSSSRSLQFDVD